MTGKWLNRLRATAVTNESRELHSQLHSIIDFYNRQSAGTKGLANIDFNNYRASIHTPSVVDKIQAKYNQFMAAEYSVDGAVSKCGTRPESMKALDVQMHYNYELWMAHYLMHLDQIETLHNIGDFTKLSKMEVAELTPTFKSLAGMQSEIGNMSPQDYVEDSYVVRIGTQFSWGSRYCPPFVHSNDAISSVVATLSKLGK